MRGGRLSYGQYLLPVGPGLRARCAMPVTRTQGYLWTCYYVRTLECNALSSSLWEIFPFVTCITASIVFQEICIV